MRHFHRGLTVLELLVVIAIITTLVGLLLPAIQAAREAARNGQCQDHLRQIGIAFHAHHEKWRSLPAGWHTNGDAATDADGETAFGWAPYILPELEEPGLFSRIDFRVPRLSSPSVLDITPPLFVCPSDDAEPKFDLFKEPPGAPDSGQASDRLLVTLPEANYVGVFGTCDPDQSLSGLGDGTFIKDRVTPLAHVTRGLSKVMFVGERTARMLPSTWIGVYLLGEDAPNRIVGAAEKGPNRMDVDECEFDSRHPGHANFLFGDGHVQAITDDVAQNVYQDFARREE
jgi:prepilin-type processing-associated H-X9-DG protein